MKKLFITLMAVCIGMLTASAQEFEVKFKDLPKDSQKYISKNYEGYTVDKAMQGQDKKGKMTYADVYVSKGTEKWKLIFDKDGEFVKKVTVAAPAPAHHATEAKHDSAATHPQQHHAPADTTKK